MTDTNNVDDVEELKAELESQQEHIEKLKKENGKWRTRYRKLQKEATGQEPGEEDDDAQDAEMAEGGDATTGGSEDQPAGSQAAQQADQLRQQAEDATARATTAEAALRTARIRLAFVEANGQRGEPFKDVDLALRTADLGAVKVEDDGTVTGLTEAMDYLAERYPYFVDDSDPDLEPDRNEMVSGRPAQTVRKTPMIDEASLLKKFPALRRR